MSTNVTRHPKLHSAKELFPSPLSKGGLNSEGTYTYSIWSHIDRNWTKSLKFIFSKKATKIDKIFTVDFTLCSKHQMDGEDFVNLRGLLRKYELYHPQLFHLRLSLFSFFEGRTKLKIPSELKPHLLNSFSPPRELYCYCRTAKTM